MIIIEVQTMKNFSRDLKKHTAKIISYEKKRNDTFNK